MEELIEERESSAVLAGTGELLNAEIRGLDDPGCHQLVGSHLPS